MIAIPQAKLPDVNAAWVKYRSYYLTCTEQEKYTNATTALDSFNALFPDDYRVEIDTQKYNKAVQTKLIVNCNYCAVQFNRNEIKVVELLAPTIIKTIIDTESEEVWFCPKCNKPNKLLNTRMIKTVYDEPAYFKVVPKPPLRKNGLQSRSHYKFEITKWLDTYVVELEHQLGLYRKEYMSQQDMDEEIPDGGEGEDAD